jgi:hypothetical protein
VHQKAWIKKPVHVVAVMKDGKVGKQYPNSDIPATENRGTGFSKFLNIIKPGKLQ